jgi:hypothetical protein
MSFQPVVPFGGLAGWTFLQRTLPAQRAAFEADPAQRRDEAHFRAAIGGIDTAEQLVADRRLLRVALEAFGLGADIANRAFIRRVLEDGTLKAGALSNRLADKRYRDFAAAFGFGDFAVPRTKLSDFPDRILAAFRERQFEAAVGRQDGDMRLALNARREIAAIARDDATDTTKWLTVLGNAPLRQVMERALGLPQGFAGQDLDRQLSALRERAAGVFGSAEMAQFADPARLEALLRRFLTIGAAPAGPAAGGSAALQLLQAGAGLFRRA